MAPAGNTCAPGADMALRLMIRRVTIPHPGISAMLWTADRDSRLLEWKEFQGDAALGVWLAGIAGKYGRENVKVDWTEQLRADARVGPLLSSMFGPPPKLTIRKPSGT